MVIRDTAPSTAKRPQSLGQAAAFALRRVPAWTTANGLTLHPDKTRMGDAREPGQGFEFTRDPDRPLVCLDETSKQLIVETRAPIPAKPGRAARHDYEYERNGVANLFMMFAPLQGWRRVKVTDRHAAVDYAQVLEQLSDVDFPDAVQIQLVQDNLSTHTPASLSAAFPAAEARRLVKRFEWHYTPNMEAGSTWPNPNWAFCRAIV